MSIRERVRKWLGVEKLPTAAMLAMLESRQSQRHAQTIAKLDAIREEQRVAFERLAALLNRRIEQPALISGAYDWDTVQAIAARALETEIQPRDWEG